ncbi:hypothetical protein JCM12856_20080 [Spirochaeta dissipatitropha]
MNSYEILMLTIPCAAKRHMRQAVKYSLHDHFPDGKNNILFEYRKISHDDSNVRIAVVVYHRPDDVPAFGSILSGLLAIKTANDLKAGQKQGASVIVACGSESIHISFDSKAFISSVEQIPEQQRIDPDCAVFTNVELNRNNLVFCRARVHTLKRKLEHENLKCILTGIAALLFSLSCMSIGFWIRATIDLNLKSEPILQEQIESINERIESSINEIIHLENDIPRTGFAFLLAHLSTFIQENSHISEFRADANGFSIMVTGSTAGSSHAQMLESSPALHEIRLRNLRLLNNGKESYTIEGKYRISASVPYEAHK